jgi:hypothetical protein
MPTCKSCKTNFGILAWRADGLCKQCGTEADRIKKEEARRKEEERLREAARIEAERKLRVLNLATTNIDQLVRTLTDDEPLMFAFVNQGITTTKKGGNGGLIVGGLMFGVVGAMIGSALDGNGEVSHEGTLGFLVVTKDKVCAATVSGAKFLTAEGAINSDHVALLLQSLKKNSATRRTFEIGGTQLSPFGGSKIVLDACSNAFAFSPSFLMVNGVAYTRQHSFMAGRNLPLTHAARNLYDEIAAKGPVASPEALVAGLRSGVNRVPAQQFARIQCRNEYVQAVLNLIWQAKDRNALVANLDCLDEPVRAAIKALIARVGRKARVTGAALLFTLASLAAACIVGFTTSDDGVVGYSVLCGAISVVTLGCVYGAGGGYRRKRWCRRVLQSPLQIAPAREPKRLLQEAHAGNRAH